MVLQYVAHWNEGTANPGYTVLHGRPQTGAPDDLASEDLAERVHALFDAIKAYIPNDYTISFPGEAVRLNTTTGVLEDVYTFTPPANVVGGYSQSWAAPAGFRYDWRTDAIVSGRRLRGRTFIVPVGGAAYADNGTLEPVPMGIFTNAGQDYIDVGVFTNVAPCIWSRTHGILADITSVVVPDEIAVLRSRRD